MSTLEILSRRTLLMVGLGKSGPVQDGGDVQLMQAQLSVAETRDNTPVIQQFGLSSNPPVGSDLSLAFIGGDRGKGMVIGTNHGPSRQKGLVPGQSVVYDQHGSTVLLSSDGNATITVTGTITMAAPTVRCTGIVLVDSNVLVGGDVSIGSQSA